MFLFYDNYNWLLLASKIAIKMIENSLAATYKADLDYFQRFLNESAILES